MHITAKAITTNADKSEGTAKPYKTIPGTNIFTIWMTVIGNSIRAVNGVGICISLLLNLNACRNQTSN